MCFSCLQGNFAGLQRQVKLRRRRMVIDLKSFLDPFRRQKKGQPSLEEGGADT
jgi:hypothetical protein